MNVFILILPLLFPIVPPFHQCLAGPTEPIRRKACHFHDYNYDGTADLLDVAVIQNEHPEHW